MTEQSIEPQVLSDLVKAMAAAKKKHGDGDASDGVWLAVEVEETGEVADALLMGDAAHAYTECIDAAVSFLAHAEMLRGREVVHLNNIARSFAMSVDGMGRFSKHIMESGAFDA